MSTSSFPALRRRAALAAAVVVTTAAIATAPPASAATTTLYASPSGTGTTCSASAPCGLAAAQAEVRSLTGAMSGDIVVELADGIYRLAQPLRFTAADSGANGYRVRVAGRPVGASRHQRRQGGHRLVGRRRRQEHLAGQHRHR